MTFTLYTIMPSPHQLPLAQEIVRLVGEENFRYVYDQPLEAERAHMGWSDQGLPAWCVFARDSAAGEWLEQADVMLVGGLRPIDLMERRLAHGRCTLYMSERWLKPIPFAFRNVYLPGWLRMFVPSYRKMARRFAALFASPHYRYLPIGPWAARDMVRVCKMVGAPCAERDFLPWGYFVTPSTFRGSGEGAASPQELPDSNGPSSLKILWVGRMLDWKRVDTIINAVRSLCPVSQAPNFHDSPLGGEAVSSPLQVERNASPTRVNIILTLVGDGPERQRLEKLACGLPVIFLPSQPIDKIRAIMRSHDVYVLLSDAEEGWGAALNEALAEGMIALGTDEAGASAAILPESQLFHAGDSRGLARLLWTVAHSSEVKWIRELPVEYTPKGAAARLMKAVEECR